MKALSTTLTLALVGAFLLAGGVRLHVADVPEPESVEPLREAPRMAAVEDTRIADLQAAVRTHEYEITLLNKNYSELSQRVFDLEHPTRIDRVNQPLQAVNWLIDPTAAEAAAKQANKPLLIACSTSPCPPCEAVKKAVYDHAPTMRVVAARCLLCRVQVGEDGNCGRFRVHQFPLCLVVNPSGAWSMFTPSDKPQEFLDRLDTAIQEAYSKGKQK